MLRASLLYDHESGCLTWIDSGLDATYKNPRDLRLYVRVKGVYLTAHRVCWALHYGEWPSRQLDHINRDVTDNRIANLRLASPSENQGNTGIRKDSPFGRKGVFTSRYGGRFSARIKDGRKMKYLGTFDTVDEAAHAYNKAAIAKFGEFACLNPIGSDYE